MKRKLLLGLAAILALVSLSAAVSAQQNDPDAGKEANQEGRVYEAVVDGMT